MPKIIILSKDTENEIIDLYLNHRLSYKKISERTGYSKSKIYRFLIKKDIIIDTIRKPGKLKDKYDIIKKSYEQGLSMAKIGNKLGTCPAAILQFMRKNNIKIRKPYKLTNEDKKEIEILYNEKFMGIKDIGKKFSLSGAPIRDYLKSKNLLRTSGETQKLRVGKYGAKKLGKRKYINIEELKRLYIEEKMSLKKISKIVDYCDVSLMNFLKEEGIILRESGFQEIEKSKLDEMIFLYNSGKTILEVGDIVGINSNTVFYHLNKMGGFIRPTGWSKIGKSLSKETIEKISNTKIENIKNGITIFKSGKEHHLFGKKIDRNIVIKQIEGRARMAYKEFIERLPKFTIYKNEVWRVTNHQRIDLLLNIEKRGQSGIENAYHLDHMFTIGNGFDNNIPPYIIGDIVNIEMLTWEDNLHKWDKCSLTKEELFERFDNRDEILEHLKEDYNNRLFKNVVIY